MRFAKPNKYRNKLTKVDGITFHSQREARRWGELKLMERAGKVKYLERQVKYSLDVNGYHICSYISDFNYSVKTVVENGWVMKVVVEDVKGILTPTYKIKRALMLACHGIKIWEV